jgi:MFS transporter, AAHS family, benzoate transport protein
MSTVKVNVMEVVDNGKFNRFHLGLLLSCCLIITFDMFDLVIYSSVLPILMAEWSMSPVQAGAIGSYGPLGMMIGAIVFGIFANKIGRKNGLIISVILFSIFTFACAFVTGPTSFGLFRFIAGVGIGGVMPNLLSLLTDYSPKHLRNQMVSIVMICFPIGGILAALAGIYLIPDLGWKSVYWISIIPLLLIPFLMKYLHDSPSMLVVKGKVAELCVALKKVNPNVTVTPDMEFEIDSQKGQVGSPVMALFKNKRALGTIMIWIAFFMCLLMINGINIWLPNLMISVGYALSSSLSFMIVLNIGAIIGTLILGNLADKFGAKKVLVPMFVMAAISLILLGFKTNIVLLYIFVAIAGACTTGAQSIAYSFVTQYYPSLMRSTAVGLASGIGRIGAIIGPTFGGILIQMNLSVQMNFLSFAIPGLIAAIAFAFVPMKIADFKGSKESKEKLVEEIA